MSVATLCDITSLSNESACFNCLSEREKWQAIEYLLRQAYNAGNPRNTVTFAQLRQAVACFTCEPNSVLTSMFVRVAGNLAVASGAFSSVPTATALRSDIKCACGVDLKEIKAMTLWLLCRATDLVNQID
jgi:hypothetical protein